MAAVSAFDPEPERPERVPLLTEINVSGNLKDMLQDIDMVGNDLFIRGSSAAPTVRMSKLMVSGL